MKITLKENWAEQDPDYIQASLTACCQHLGVSPQVQMWLRIGEELKDHVLSMQSLQESFLLKSHTGVYLSPVIAHLCPWFDKEPTKYQLWKYKDEDERCCLMGVVERVPVYRGVVAQPNPWKVEIHTKHQGRGPGLLEKNTWVWSTHVLFKDNLQHLETYRFTTNPEARNRWCSLR